MDRRLARVGSLSSGSESSSSSDSEGETGRRLRSAVVIMSNSPTSRKRQRVPPDSPTQCKRRSSSPPLDQKGYSRPSHRSEGEEGEWVERGEAPPPPKKKKEEIDPILTRTGVTMETVSCSQ